MEQGNIACYTTDEQVENEILEDNMKYTHNIKNKLKQLKLF